jgi:hypothetical protein
MGEAPHHYLIFETAGGFCGIAWNNLGTRASSCRQKARWRPNEPADLSEDPSQPAAVCYLARGGGSTQLTVTVWPRSVSLAAGSQRHERAGWSGLAPLPPWLALATGSNALAPLGGVEGRDTPRQRAALTWRRVDCRAHTSRTCWPPTTTGTRNCRR